MSVSREETQSKLDLLASGVMKHVPEQTYTVPDRFEEYAVEYPDKTFLIYNDTEISYAELNRQANRYANAALQLGIAPGDVAAVMIENRPEFFYAWLGLSKVGAIAALINTQARDKALAHAIEETGSKLLFLGAECAALYSTVDGLSSRIKTLVVADGEVGADLPAGTESVVAYLDGTDEENPSQSLRAAVVGETPLFYVFTSGTTGLPKAAIISHMRWLGVGEGWAAVLKMTPEDVCYCILPLFHGAAGMSLVSNALASKAAIVLRRKFSASAFWDEVRRYKITTVQYIGEICRYLVNRPAADNDKDHTLLRMTGAGMTQEVWRKFIDRFGDVDIYEGWGSTEANCSMMNLDSKIGSCGRIPFKDRSNARLVKYDIENDEYVSDENGFLVECEPGEVGEVLGMVLNIPGVGAGRFEGYTSAEATEKKIRRNVFAQGDAWFQSGDLFTCDEDGYFYFVDRMGDTYRWKSENVSTTEVVEALEDFDAAETINVYGVAVPEHEGRAGMVAIQLRENAEFDSQKLYQMVKKNLPSYAVPLFVRVSRQADITATFKLRKVDLQKAGYNPNNFEDQLFVMDADTESYIAYSEQALSNIGVKPFQ